MPCSSQPSLSGRIATVAELHKQRQRTLAKFPIFSGLTESELAFLAKRAVSRRYSAENQCLGKASRAWGLTSSSPAMYEYSRALPAGGTGPSLDGPGSSIAEVPVFDGGVYPASATAVEDATLLFVDKQDFRALCLAHPQVGLKVLHVLGARLRRLVEIIEELSFTTVRHRLASYLLRLSQNSGKRTAEGTVVSLPVNNQELAAQIGTVRELVSRNLSRLQAEGLLKIDGREVTLRNLEALEEEVQKAMNIA